LRIPAALMLVVTACAVSPALAKTTMTLDIQESCTTQGAGLNFECEAEDNQLGLIIDGDSVIGVNPSGTPLELSVNKATQEILVLDNPVFFDGTSTIYITFKDSSFYWVEGAYSTILQNRSYTVRSGRVIVHEGE